MTKIPGSLHGACTRQQALDALGQYGLRTALRRGELAPLWRGVLVDPARLLDQRTRATAALIAVGTDAVICGPTALALHGCTAADDPTVHVTLRYNRWSSSDVGLRVHHGRLSDDDVVDAFGLPVLVLDLALADVLCTAARRLALVLADQAVALHQPSDRGEFLDDVARRIRARVDRRGTRQARGLLPLIDASAESPRESVLRLVVVDAGFPLPAVQHEVLDAAGVPVWRLDLAWPSLKIALEYDGYEAHAGRASRDAARDEDLRRRGWVVLRARAEDLRHPGPLLDALAEAFGRRGAPLRHLRTA
jgi:Protein of unknown function (DUF559)